jgi:hypothetical protein
MRKRVIDLRTERPCLDIASFGRRGPETKLTPSEVDYVQEPPAEPRKS